jgi:hypothetical protein
MTALSISTVAAAQTAPAAAAPTKVKSGERVYTSDGAVVGRIEYVERAKDGSLKDVGVIHDMRMVHIPADSLSDGPNGVVTSLKRAEVNKLN